MAPLRPLQTFHANINIVYGNYFVDRQAAFLAMGLLSFAGWTNLQAGIGVTREAPRHGTRAQAASREFCKAD
jgi:hypothetical protein